MKIILLLVSTIAVALVEPAVIYTPPSNNQGAQAQTTSFARPGQHYDVLNWQHGGSGSSYDDSSKPANYHFEYHVVDAKHGNDFGHQETRQGDVAQGRYFVLLPDGRRQIVDYVADKNGYRPKVFHKGSAFNFGSAQGSYPKPGGYTSNGGSVGADGYGSTEGYTGTGSYPFSGGNSNYQQ